MNLEEAHTLKSGDKFFSRQYNCEFTFEKLIHDYEDVTENRHDEPVLVSHEGPIVKLDQASIIKQK